MQRGSNPLKLYPFPHNQFNEGYKAMHSRICGSSGKVFVEKFVRREARHFESFLTFELQIKSPAYLGMSSQ